MAFVTMKWNLRGFKLRQKKWLRANRAEQLDAVKAYAGEGAKQMVACTPPAGKGKAKLSVAKGLAALKKRIKRDFEGDGLQPFSDEDIVWRRDKYGRLRARIVGNEGKTTGYPSPFRVYTGRVSSKKLAALGVGAHRVEYAENVGAFIQSHPSQYKMERRRGSSAVRLNWYGVRHVASVRAVKAEMKARQGRVGSLMAGWKALAHKAGGKLQARVERQQGKGSATLNRRQADIATITGSNRGNYPGLQSIVDRQMPKVQKKIRNMARARAKKMGKKL